jgi:glutamate/tyrosine decarboxylase-like PLP-dependent enzyme
LDPLPSPSPSARPPVRPSALIAAIREAQAASRVLDPTAAEREALRGPVLAYADRFLEALATAPTFVETEDKGRGVLELPIGESGVPLGTILETLQQQVDRPALNPASGGHMGYIPGGGLYASAWGDYLADVTNRYSGVFFGGPGAVRVEHLLTRWMADLAGLPESAAGTLTSGGSIANLVALVAARDAAGLRGRDAERTVVYLSSQTHHCVTKALRLIGLGDAVVREVPLDPRYRMRPDALEAAIAADRAAGLRPWLVVASAGSTDVGAVDPLAAVGAVAKAAGLWFHVDAAYGGFFLLTDTGRARLEGIALADSVVMDPHKTLFLPYGLGVALVRDRAHLLEAFRSAAPYLQDTLSAVDELSPSDLSPELTRPFRGLRLWLPLLLYGVAPFRAALEEKLLLARYFRERVAAAGFEVGPEPDLSVVTYRWVPVAMRDGRVPLDRERVNRINARIIELVRRDGRTYISSTMLEGDFTLRMACVVHRTHLETIETLLEVLAAAAAEAERDVLAGASAAVTGSTP